MSTPESEYPEVVADMEYDADRIIADLIDSAAAARIDIAEHEPAPPIQEPPKQPAPPPLPSHIPVLVATHESGEQTRWVPADEYQRLYRLYGHALGLHLAECGKHADTYTALNMWRLLALLWAVGGFAAGWAWRMW
jgi:hypothetical protein